MSSYANSCDAIFLFEVNREFILEEVTHNARVASFDCDMEGVTAVTVGVHSVNFGGHQHF